MAIDSDLDTAAAMEVATEKTVATDMRLADVVFASMAIAYENSLIFCYEQRVFWRFKTSDSTGEDVATTATVIATTNYHLLVAIY